MSGLNRRQLLRLSAGAGFGLGLGHLASAKDSPIFQQIMSSAMRADFSGMAYAADKTAKRTLVHIVLIDKTQTALFQHINDAAANAPLGATAQAGIAQELFNFREIPLTKLFGDALKELPGHEELGPPKHLQALGNIRAGTLHVSGHGVLRGR